MLSKDGTTIPRGKYFELSLCTVSIWKDDVMIEEQLYCDKKPHVNQLGLAN